MGEEKVNVCIGSKSNCGEEDIIKDVISYRDVMEKGDDQ